MISKPLKVSCVHVLRYRTADENEHRQTNLNEAELSILSDQECMQYGTYRDVITKKLLKVSWKNSTVNIKHVPLCILLDRSTLSLYCNLNSNYPKSYKN